MHRYQVIVYDDPHHKAITYDGYEAEDKLVARAFGEAIARVFFPGVATKVHVIWLEEVK